MASAVDCAAMIVTDNPTYGFMIAHRAGVGYDPYVNRVLARCQPDGSLLGGVIYTNFTGRSVQMHVAGEPGWGTRKMLWMSFDYPFFQLGVERVLAIVGAHQHKLREYYDRLGFKEIARVPDIVHEGDVMILSMMREECVWLKLRPRYIKQNGHAGELAA